MLQGLVMPHCLGVVPKGTERELQKAMNVTTLPPQSLVDSKNVQRGLPDHDFEGWRLAIGGWRWLVVPGAVLKGGP